MPAAGRRALPAGCRTRARSRRCSFPEADVTMRGPETPMHCRPYLAVAVVVLSASAVACSSEPPPTEAPAPAPATPAPSGPLNRAYVTNENSGDLTVIDLNTDTVVATIPLGKRPRGIQANRD